MECKNLSVLESTHTLLKYQALAEKKSLKDLVKEIVEKYVEEYKAGENNENL